jgi:ParB/RepB/Spo0J family partition protein
MCNARATTHGLSVRRVPSATPPALPGSVDAARLVQRFAAIFAAKGGKSWLASPGPFAHDVPHPRRADCCQWRRARTPRNRRAHRGVPPISDLASIASFRLDAHPCARLATAVERVLCGGSFRSPISFQAASAAAKARGVVEDRLVHSLPLSAIQPNPRNPRQRIDDIGELADSTRAYRLLQPIVVRRRGAGYELIAGHRRREAARFLGWLEIAATVRDESDDDAYLLTLVENLQRQGLSPKEEAAALEVLVRERGWSTRQVGDAIKRSPMYVSKRLRVFEDPVLGAPVLINRLPVSTAEELLRLPDDEREQRSRGVGGAGRDAARGRASDGCQNTVRRDPHTDVDR